MKINMALWDRVLRFVFGILLAGWAVAGGPWWGYFGFYMIVTSGWGLCPLYGVFKVKTVQEESHGLVPPE
jgi:hypothetical protein